MEYEEDRREHTGEELSQEVELCSEMVEGEYLTWNIVTALEGSYLRVETPNTECVFEEEMLLQNEIAGFLPLGSLWRGGRKEFQYDITGLVSLSKEFQGRKVSGEEYRRLFAGIFESIAKGKKYLLQEDDFWLSPEVIFVDREAGTVHLCYVPGLQWSMGEQMRSLSDWLLDFVDAQDREAVYCGYAFHVLAHSDTCSFGRLEEVLRQGENVEGRIGEGDGKEREMHRQERQVTVVDTVCEPAKAVGVDGKEGMEPQAVHQSGERLGSGKKGWIQGVIRVIRGILVFALIVFVVFWVMY